MEGRDQKNKDEQMLAQQGKLVSVDKLLKEVLQKKIGIEESVENEEILSSNKFKDLINMRSLLQEKLEKMEPEIATIKENIEERLKLVKNLAENSEQLQNEFAEKESVYWKEYFDTVSQLEAELEKERMEYQIDRDMKLLMEKVREKFKNDKQRSMKVAIYAKRRQAALMRQENLEKTKEKLDEEEKSTLEQIEKLKEKQKILKEKYDSLLEVYNRTEKAKVALQASAT